MVIPVAPPPAVAVVVPAFRVADFIADTLRSVQEQTWTSWECVVVDDGSDDGTAAVAATFVAADARFRLLRQANRGLSGARNAGLAEVTPGVPFVAFLDSDDLWCPDALASLLAALADDPGAVGAYGYAELVDERGAPLTPGLHPARQRDRHRLVGWRRQDVAESDPVVFDEWLLDGPVWPPAVALHRRDVLDLVGPFDEQLRQLEDVDLYTRTARHGHYRPICRQVAWYRQHPGQMTRRRVEFWHAHDVLRRKTWASSLNTPAQRASAARAWRVAQARRVARCAQRLGAALRARRWGTAARLGRGLAVLLWQGLHRGPPVARVEHVEWTGRGV